MLRATTLDETANSRARRPDRAGRRLRAEPQGRRRSARRAVAPSCCAYFYRHVAPEDLARAHRGRPVRRRDEPVPAGRRPAAGHRQRPRLHPDVAEHGWSAGGHTVVEVVTDDMPFLVDSVTMELNEQNRDVHMVVHPQILVRRDITGQLQEVLPTTTAVDRADAAARRAPASRGCTSRSTASRARPSATRSSGRWARCCSDVREAVEDWPKMHAAGAATSSTTSSENPPPLPAEEVDEGQALLRWLADDHFTFLGYREYRLEDVDGDDGRRRCAPCPAPASASCAPTRTCPRRSAKLPPAGRGPRPARRRCWCWPRPTPRPTVHRPVYLDYVGVKTFDENGEVVGERRFLGLFSLGRLHRVADPHPGDPGEGQAGASTAPGFDAAEPHRQGADGRARDLPARRAVPDPDRGAACRSPRRCCTPASAASCGCSSAATPTAATCPAWSTCRATATPPRSASGSPAILKQPARRRLARVHRPGQRVAARPAALRRSGPSPGELIGDFDQADLERRLAEAARSWRDDFVAAAHAEYGEEDGAAAGPQVRRLVPRGLQGGLPAADRGGRPRPARGHRRRRRPRPVASTSRSTAGPRRGAAEGLPHRLAAVAVRGAADPVLDGRRGRRRAALRARRARAASRYIYDFGLRYHRRAARPARRELFQDAVNAVWEGDNESRRLQRAGARRRADLAAGDRAARLREVHAPGRHAVRAGLHRGRAAQQRRHHPAAWCSCSRRASTPGRSGDTRRPTARPGRRKMRRDRGPHPRGPSTTSPASTTTGSCGPT